MGSNNEEKDAVTESWKCRPRKLTRLNAAERIDERRGVWPWATSPVGRSSEGRQFWLSVRPKLRSIKPVATKGPTI